MGQITARQSIFYQRVYSWGPQIEVNIGEVTAAFLKNFQPARERCWVADVDGAMAGSVFLTDAARALPAAAALRRAVRPGLGLGNTLVEACLWFAREVGYRQS